MEKSSLKKVWYGLLICLTVLLAAWLMPVCAAVPEDITSEPTLPILPEIYVAPDSVSTNAVGDDKAASSANFKALFDGKSTSGAAWQNIPKDTYVQVDFGTPVTIEQIEIRTGENKNGNRTNNNNGVKKVTLYVSSDGAKWEPVGTIDNTITVEAAVETLYHDMGKVAVDTLKAARYFKISLDEVGNWNAKIFEIKFYSSNPGDILSDKQIVSYTKYYPSWQDPANMPASLTDGDASTRWAADGTGKDADAPHEVVIDLGQNYQINRWFMANQTWGSGSGYFDTNQFALSYLDVNPDGGTQWKDFASRGYEATVESCYGGTLTDSVVARYVKLAVYKSGKNTEDEGHASIDDVNVQVLALYGMPLPETQQASLVAVPYVMPGISSLQWDSADNANFKLTPDTENNKVKLEVSVYNGIANSVTNGFALPDGYSLAGAQKLALTFSKDATEGAKPRLFRVILDEDTDGVREQFAAEIYIKTGSGSETFSIPVDTFIKVESEEGDGKLDLSKVSHISLTACSNIKDNGPTTTVINFEGLTVYKGVMAAIPAPIRLEKANDEDGWDDITMAGLESGNVRIVGGIQNLNLEAQKYMVFAGLYELTDQGAVLKQVAVSALNDVPYGEVKAFTLPLTVPAEGEYQIKTYIWHDNALIPITMVRVFEGTTPPEEPEEPEEPDDSELTVKENLFADDFNTNYETGTDATEKLYSHKWHYVDAKTSAGGLLQVENIDGSNVLFMGKSSGNSTAGPLAQAGNFTGMENETVQVTFRFKPYNNTNQQFKVTATDANSHYLDFIYAESDKLTFCGEQMTGMVKLDDWNQVRMILDFKNKKATLYFNDETTPVKDGLDITGFLSNNGLDTSSFNMRFNAWLWGDAQVGYYIDDVSVDVMGPAGGEEPSTPTVAIISPAAGQTFIGLSAITLTAGITPDSAVIDKVEFYVDDTKVGEDTTAPYSYTWTPDAFDTYSIAAKAYAGVSVYTSDTVPVTVTEREIPTVTLTAPQDGESLELQETELQAAVTTPNGETVTRVVFFVNGMQIGEDTIAPYSYSWTPDAYGAYTVLAKAYIDAAEYVSAPIAITVDETAQDDSFSRVISEYRFDNYEPGTAPGYDRMVGECTRSKY